MPETRSNPVSIDTTPGVDTSDPALQRPVPPETPTFRLIQGRYTLDVLPALDDRHNILLFVSTGELGTPPVNLSLPIGFLPLLAEMAAIVRPRRVIDTAAWSSPLVRA